MDCYVNKTIWLWENMRISYSIENEDSISFFKISFRNLVLLMYIYIMYSNRNYSKFIMKLAISFEINVNEKNEEEIEIKE